MARVNIKGIPEIEKKYRETFKKVRKNKQMLNEVGKFSVDTIAMQARRGKPLNTTQKFPKLKPVSVGIRGHLSRNNTTHPTFKKQRSNLTFTGQLVDALQFTIDSSVLRVDVEDSLRWPVLKKDGSPSGKDMTNREVDADLRSRGFRMFTKKGIDSSNRFRLRINNILKKYVRRAIKFNFRS